MSLRIRAGSSAAALAFGLPLVAGAAWSPPATIYSSNTIVSDRASVAGRSGSASAVWATGDFTNYQILFSEQRNGVWSSPVLLPNSSNVSTEPTLTAGPDGSLYAGFVDSSANGGSLVERRATSAERPLGAAAGSRAGRHRTTDRGRR